MFCVVRESCHLVTRIESGGYFRCFLSNDVAKKEIFAVTHLAMDIKFLVELFSVRKYANMVENLALNATFINKISNTNNVVLLQNSYRIKRVHEFCEMNTRKIFSLPCVSILKSSFYSSVSYFCLCRRICRISLEDFCPITLFPSICACSSRFLFASAISSSEKNLCSIRFRFGRVLKFQAKLRHLTIAKHSIQYLLEKKSDQTEARNGNQAVYINESQCRSASQMSWFTITSINATSHSHRRNDGNSDPEQKQSEISGTINNKARRGYVTCLYQKCQMEIQHYFDF